MKLNTDYFGLGEPDQLPEPAAPAPVVLLPKISIAVTEDDDAEDDSNDPLEGDWQARLIRQNIMNERPDSDVDDVNTYIEEVMVHGLREDNDVIQATVLLMLDSSQLQRWAYDHIVERAVAALAYVKYEGVADADPYHFDANLETVIENWDVWASEMADEAISESVTIPDHLEQYYSFDYEEWANSLRDDYKTVDVDTPSGYATLVFSL